jgi:hypothetical protein
MNLSEQDRPEKSPLSRAFLYNLRPSELTGPNTRRLRGAKHTAKGCMATSGQGGAWLFRYWLVRYEVS